MKNKLILSALTLIALSIPLVSCEGGSSDETTSIDVSDLTLTATCPEILFVGDSDLVYFDVEGSDDDRASYTSSDPAVLSVSDEGVINALKVGTVTLTATSIPYPNLSKEFNVEVVGQKATSVSLVIKTEDDDIITEGNKLYSIPVGKEITLSYELDETLFDKPDSFHYSIVDQTGEYLSIASLEQDGDEAVLTTYSELTNLTVTLSCSYSDSIGATIKDSLIFNAYNKNAAVFEQLNGVLNTLDENGLVSSKVDIYENEEDFVSYNQLSKDNITSVSTTDSILYNVSDESTNRHFVFDTDLDNVITTIYVNDAFASSSLEEMQKTSMLYTKMVDGSFLYGHLSIIDYIITNASYGKTVGFGYYSANAYASIEFLTNEINIATSYVDENDMDVTLTFNIQYNNENKLTGYDYIYEDDVTYYREHAYDFSYEPTTQNHTIDMDDYYIEQFEIGDAVGLVDDNGSYDYSDETKYGYETKEIVDGVPHYTVPYEKQLPLKVNVISPATASFLIDAVVVTGVSSNGTRTLQVMNNGIVGVSAPKDETSGDSLAISETFTFTTTKGITQTVVVEFIKTEVTSVSLLNEGNANIVDNVFPNLFNNSYSGYFYLTSNPEDSAFVYKMKVLEGDVDGISLYNWEKDNIYSYPYFSYSILAHKVGHYEFAFYIEGAEDVLSETYSIDVIEPYSSSYIEENIVGQTYLYTTGTVDFTLNVTSATKMNIVQTDYLGTNISVDFNYTISDGQINVDGEQTFGNDFYFSHIRDGIIQFNDDFSSLTLYLNFRDELATTLSYQAYTFNKQMEAEGILDHINGNTYTTSQFIIGYNMSTISISFNDGTGTLVFTNQNGEFARFTFNYSYQEGLYNDYFVFTNVTCTADFTFNSEMMDYYPDTRKLSVKVNIPGTYGTSTFEFTLI